MDARKLSRASNDRAREWTGLCTGLLLRLRAFRNRFGPFRRFGFARREFEADFAVFIHEESGERPPFFGNEFRKQIRLPSLEKFRHLCTVDLFLEDDLAGAEIATAFRAD